MYALISDLISITYLLKPEIHFGQLEWPFPFLTWHPIAGYTLILIEHYHHQVENSFLRQLHVRALPTFCKAYRNLQYKERHPQADCWISSCVGTSFRSACLFSGGERGSSYRSVFLRKVDQCLGSGGNSDSFFSSRASWVHALWWTAIPRRWRWNLVSFGQISWYSWVAWLLVHRFGDSLLLVAQIFRHDVGHDLLRWS